MRIIYMGTPDFAVAPLEKLIENGYEVVLVVTQPDREKGRGRGIAQSPVKECALKHGIEVFQPIKIREAQNVEFLKKYDADIFIVAAFGQILSEELLNMPKFGCINIHASLLPKYRGSAPIQWAILNGDSVTGVTIMQMAKGVDTGDILSQKSIPITSEDTGESLFDKLMYLGADLLIETLPSIESGEIIPIKQDESQAVHVGKLSTEMGRIDWSMDAEVLERYVRGLNSWPSAYTTINGKTLKIWQSKVTDVSENAKDDIPFGTIIAVGKDSFTVKCRNGALEVYSLQLEGKKRMSAHDFMLGYEIKAGQKLG